MKCRITVIRKPTGNRDRCQLGRRRKGMDLEYRSPDRAHLRLRTDDRSRQRSGRWQSTLGRSALGFPEESGSVPVELGETCLEVTDDRAESARGEEPWPERTRRVLTDRWKSSQRGAKPC
jgi:hypothetical protein